MSKYNFNERKYSTHQCMIRMIRNIADDSSAVLDIGCNAGYLGGHVNRGQWIGIEKNADLLTFIEKNRVYKKIYIDDINKFDFNIFQKDGFDLIIFGDILEHLIDPDKIIKKTKPLIKENGKIVISLPNIANFRIRLKLCLGLFTYTETGILDKTHLHFYEKHSAREFVQRNGLIIEKLIFTSSFFGPLITPLPILGPLLGHEIIILARKER